MARLTNPALPDAVIETDDERAAVLRKSGWVDAESEPEATGTETVVETGTHLVGENGPELFIPPRKPRNH